MSRKKIQSKIDKAIRFQCSGCGRCCFGHPDQDMIELASGEAQRIQQYLDIDRKTFSRRYLVQLSGQQQGIRIDETGRCVFLDEQMQCTIYQVRPRQCSSYPFWPELMQSKQAWLAEAGRCEGIDQGAVVPVEVIKQKLALFK